MEKQGESQTGVKAHLESAWTAKKSGTARFASGLTCNDFLRANSMVYVDRIGLANLAPDIDVLATTEGLTAQRNPNRIRCCGI